MQLQRPSSRTVYNHLSVTAGGLYSESIGIRGSQWAPVIKAGGANCKSELIRRPVLGDGATRRNKWCGKRSPLSAKARAARWRSNRMRNQWCEKCFPFAPALPRAQVDHLQLNAWFISKEMRLFRVLTPSCITLKGCTISKDSLVSLIKSLSKFESLHLQNLTYLKSNEESPEFPFSRPLEKLSVGAVEPGSIGHQSILNFTNDLSKLGLQVNEVTLEGGNLIEGWTAYADPVIRAFGANVKSLRMPPVLKSRCNPLHSYVKALVFNPPIQIPRSRTSRHARNYNPWSFALPM